MNDSAPGPIVAQHGQSLPQSHQTIYVFCLYVTGMTNRFMAAITAMKSFCEQNLTGRYELRVINLYKHPEMAQEHDIIAAPTLIKQFPPPLRRIVGDLSNHDRLFLFLL
jgi:circadian clock protein KaiB